MNWPTLKTYDRVNEDPNSSPYGVGFEKSYLGMRLVIGVLGVALPLLLVLVDGLLIEQPLTIRGSMSAYYHSPARDLFVGGLAACGVTLTSYMFWKWWTWDFIVSLVGGFAVLGVATFPTARPRDPSAHLTSLDCSYTHDGVPPCTALQQALGEGTVRTIHLWVTAFVVAAFAGLCLIFALREFGYGRAAHTLSSGQDSQLGPVRTWRKLKSDQQLGVFDIARYTWQKAPRTMLYLGCLVGVILGAVWAPLGKNIVVPHTYAGEFIAFTSFGCAWLVASWDLLKQVGMINAAVQSVGSTLGVTNFD